MHVHIITMADVVTVPLDKFRDIYRGLVGIVVIIYTFVQAVNDGRFSQAVYDLVGSVREVKVHLSGGVRFEFKLDIDAFIQRHGRIPAWIGPLL